MSARYDVVVIGGGHNGLTAAALLAKAGRRVLIAEARDSLGGLADGEEFHTGYRHAGILHSTEAVRTWVLDALELDQHGLSRRPPAELFVPQVNGPGLVLDASGESSDRLEPTDVNRLAAYRRFTDRIAPALRRLLDRPPPDLVDTGVGDLVRLGLSGLALRRLGTRDMMEVLRAAPMPVADWLDEWFVSDLLKAALGAPAVYSTYTGPRSPGSNANLLIAEAVADRPIAGGSPGLVRALESAARAAGVEIRTGSPVNRILVDNGRASGVRIGDRTVPATAVAASCDPKQAFLDLLPQGVLTRGFETELTHFRSRGTAAKVHLALTGYPEFSSRPGQVFEHVRTGESLDELERAFDAVKYRRVSDRPVLDIRFPTVETPELAPSCHHVASILVSFAPFALNGAPDGRWNDSSRDRLYRAVLETLASYAPGVEDLVAGAEVLSPADLAERYRLTEGHLFHGEHALDQLVIRPALAAARYETPVPGLYLCGSGSHPGGGITCAPGALAARAMLR
ncbi:MAG: phytoene desaturase family protein [Thermoanaerobaculia bacterium]